MAQVRRIPGDALTTVGAAGLIASLWSSWYAFQVPSAWLDQVAQSAQQYGVLAPYISRGAELVRQLGPLHLNAWQVSTATPAALLVVGVVAGGLSLLTLAGSATGVSRVVMRVGLAGVVICLYRLAVAPGRTGLLHPAWGLYVALAASIAVVLGGQISTICERADTHPPVTLDLSSVAPTGLSTANSVPPPGAG